jgi:shikimate kinase
MLEHKLILLRGYPGSGKTTIGKELENRGVGTFIDHNSILTFVAGIAGNDEGIYDEIANLELAIAKKLLSEGESVIVARGFTKLAQLAVYEAMADSIRTKKIVVRLDVDRNELLERVQSPERKLDFNPTTTESAADEWMNENPMESHPNEAIIDNNQPMHNTVNAIETLVANR